MPDIDKERSLTAQELFEIYISHVRNPNSKITSISDKELSNLKRIVENAALEAISRKLIDEEHLNSTDEVIKQIEKIPSLLSDHIDLILGLLQSPPRSDLTGEDVLASEKVNLSHDNKSQLSYSKTLTALKRRLMKARELAFEDHSKVEVRVANKNDIVSVLNVEWFVFNSYLDMDGRWRPSILRHWFLKKPQMFLVGEIKYENTNYVIAYGVLVPLAESGYNKFINGEGRSIVHLEEEDVDLTENPKYLSLEVIACMNPRDTITGMLLIRNILHQIPASCEIFTASPASEFGLKLVKRYNFQKVWSDPLSDWALYAIDLADPVNKEMFQKLNLGR